MNGQQFDGLAIAALTPGRTRGWELVHSGLGEGDGADYRRRVYLTFRHPCVAVDLAGFRGRGEVSPHPAEES